MGPLRGIAISIIALASAGAGCLGIAWSRSHQPSAFLAVATAVLIFLPGLLSILLAWDHLHRPRTDP